MTIIQIILPNKDKKVINYDFLLLIFLNEKKLELSDLLADLVNLADARIFQIIDIDMITKEINVIKEFFLCFLE